MNQFLQICESIETTVAEIYHELSVCPSFSPELRTIWLQMAKEEEEHAMQFTFAQRLGGTRILSGRNLPKDRVQELLEKAQDLLIQVREVPLSESEAVNLTMTLERDFLDVHILASAQFSDPKMAEMFGSLAKGDEKHVEALQQYLSRNARLTSP